MPAPPAVEPCAPSDGAGSVLLVDDDGFVLRSWARVLRASGYTVETLNQSANLPDVLRGGRFDAVVTDIRMAGVDGFDVLREVHARAPQVPVLLATGAAELSGAMRAVNDGAFRYLEKPLERTLLLKAVADAVRQHRSACARDEAPRDGAGDASAGAGGVERLATRFEAALAKRWIAFQPLVARGSGALWGCEALLRSAEPGFVRPAELLAAAEGLHRVADVGRLVRADVAAALATAAPALTVFVNLHPGELDDPELYHPGAPLSRFAARVVLEITERASLADVSDLPQHVAALRALGYRIAVDDLGAGYAGLASFARLRPDVVKIDMSLVRGIEADPMRRTLVDSIVRASHELGIRVVAEGIETQAERAALELLEVDLLQGYLLGRPQHGLPDAAGNAA